MQSDLYGQSLLNITHPEDHAFLKQQLIPSDLHNLFAAKTDENGEIRSRTQEEEEEIDKKLREDRRDFTIRQVSIALKKTFDLEFGQLTMFFHLFV